MDNAVYALLTRQAGLMQEFTSIANNIANTDTTGFKAEGAVFSEYVARLEGGSSPGGSLSMGRLAAHATNFADGSLRQTGGPLDVAISGTGFFQVQGTDGVWLTRSGHFQTDEVGRLVDPLGAAVLDAGGGEIVLPPNVGTIDIASDGTIIADGVQIAVLGVVQADPEVMSRIGSNYWRADVTQPVDGPVLASGFLEDSNVDPVLQMARMIEVQRFYDAGQALLDQEDDRIKSVAQMIRQMS